MEREQKQVDRAEIERRRDSYIERRKQMLIVKSKVRGILSVLVAGDRNAALRHECEWLISAMDNRTVELLEKSERQETLMLMLDEQAEQVRITKRVNVLLIGGNRV